MKNVPTDASKLIDQAIALKPRPRTYIMRALINADRSSFTEALADLSSPKSLTLKTAMSTTTWASCTTLPLTWTRPKRTS